jgi:hypothetical protein
MNLKVGRIAPRTPIWMPGHADRRRAQSDAPHLEVLAPDPKPRDYRVVFFNLNHP